MVWEIHSIGLILEEVVVSVTTTKDLKKNTNIYATCLFLVTPLRTSLSAFNKDIAFVITVSVKQ